MSRIRIPEMQDAKKSKQQLIDELVQMRQEVARMQAAESKLQTLADALRQSATQFRKITEKSIVGVYLIQDDVFKYVNPKMAHIFGYTVKQLVDGRGPEDLVADEDWPQVKEYLRQRLEGEIESVNYSFRGKKRNGERIHVEVYGSRMDYHGRYAVMGTIVEITQRIRAEHALETQLKRFQTLYHLAMAMTAEHSLEENLGLLVDKCLELLETDISFIAVCNAKSKSLRVCALAGTDARSLQGLDLPVSSHLNQQRATAGKACQLGENFTVLAQSCKREFIAMGVHCGIAVPVKVEDRDLGVLCVGSKEERSFSDSEKNLLSLIGNMAALEINRKQAEEALGESEGQLRLLSRQLLKVQEDERKRVAQDLHDGIGQSVTAMKFEVETVIRKAANSVPEKHLAPLQSLLAMIQEVVEDVGRIAMDLRPSILDDLGILSTIAWLCREFSRTHPEIRVKKELAMEENQIPEHHKIVIFRILQEALNNIAKHSRAKSVHLSLRKCNGQTELMIRDDGVGFDWDFLNSRVGRERGFGLASMKERTQLSGGAFSIKTRKGTGTKIVACWPTG